MNDYGRDGIEIQVATKSRRDTGGGNGVGWIPAQQLTSPFNLMRWKVWGGCCLWHVWAWSLFTGAKEPQKVNDHSEERRPHSQTKTWNENISDLVPVLEFRVENVDLGGFLLRSKLFDVKQFSFQHLLRQGCQTRCHWGEKSAIQFPLQGMLYMVDCIAVTITY